MSVNVSFRESSVDQSPKIGEEEDVKNERQKILREESDGDHFVLKTNSLTKVRLSLIFLVLFLEILLIVNNFTP